MERLLNINELSMGAIQHRIERIDAFKAAWGVGYNFTPDQLVELRHLATIQSVGSSTRIEGSELQDEEVARLIENMKIERLESRDQQEVMGYFRVAEIVLDNYPYLPISESMIKGLHKQLLQFSEKDEWYRGAYKQHSNQVVATLKTGEVRTIFPTTDPIHTAQAMTDAVTSYERLKADPDVHPLLAIGAFIYEFLSIHPFQDGNGRLSRLLTNFLLLREGYEFIQYASLEHEIEMRKPKYYLALMSAQRHRGTEHEVIHSWLSFLLDAILRVIEKLQRDEQQILEEPAVLYLNRRQQRVMDYVRQHETLSVGQLDKFYMTDTSRNTVKYDLKKLTEAGLLRRLGKGRGTVYALNR